MTRLDCNGNALSAGLPFPNFQMGFTNVRMGYIWGTFLVIMRYTVEIHSFPFDRKRLLGKTVEIKSEIGQESYSDRRNFENRRKCFTIEMLECSKIRMNVI